MSEFPGESGLEHEFERLLEAARRRVHRAAIQAGLVRTVELMLYALVGLAAACLALRLIGAIAGRPAWLGGRTYAGLAVAVCLALVGWAAIRGWRTQPSLEEAAERLDLAVADHNRIAIGLSLLGQDAPGPFANAAIKDGLAYLNRLWAQPPYVEPTRLPLARGVSLAGAFAVLTAITVLWSPVPTSPGGSDVAAAAAVLSGPVRGGVTEPRTERRPETPEASKLPPAPAPGAPSTAEHTAELPGHPRGEPGAGRPGAGAHAQAEASDRTAGASSDSTSAATGSRSAKPPRDNPTRAANSSRARSTRTLPPKRTPEQEGSSAVGLGSTGGGAMSPVQHSWTQEASALAGDQPDQETEENVEDESRTSVQRGGVQPSLKDRNEAPSRELGISGEEGPPGTGRGGPTPPKKSRGTASLVLGVPVPDFVKGRLGAGTTKIAYERVEPSPMPGDPVVPASAAERTGPEAILARFDVPPALAEVVRSYLLALHSSDRPPEDQAALPTPIGEGVTEGADTANERTQE